MVNQKSSLYKRAGEFLEKNHANIKRLPPRNVKNLIEDLHIHQIELEMQNEELHRIQQELEEARDQYSDLYNFAPVGYFTLSDKGNTLEANLTGANMLGVERELVIGKPFYKFINRDDQDAFYHLRRKLAGTKIEQTCELRIVNNDGSQFYAQMICIPVLGKNKNLEWIRASVTDITKRKQAEEELQKAYKQLEIKTVNLEEANVALKILLKKNDDDNNEIEEKVLLNIKGLVIPYLDIIRKSGLNDRQNEYIDALEVQLKDIISPFSHTLSSKYSRLTRKEIQVANLVREGKPTKNISEIMSSSTRTIESHRKSIRKKLGLQNAKTNLRTHLLSFS